MISMLADILAQCPCSGGGSTGRMSKVTILMLAALGFGL